MHKLKPVIYVGYDLKEHRGYEVLVHSIKKYNDKYNIVPLMEPTLRRIGLYRRIDITHVFLLSVSVSTMFRIYVFVMISNFVI